MASVQGFKEFELYNSYGRVSLGAPVELFGPLPMVDSFFELRSPQVFSRLTRSVTLYLEWQDCL